MPDYKVDLKKMAWESPLGGLRFKAMKDDVKQLRLVEYGGDMEPHWCEKGHIGYVLEGQFEITFEKEVAIFNPGDGIFIPPGAEHRHMGKALTDVVRAVMIEDI